MNLLFSIALLLVCGIVAGALVKKIKLPTLVGMIGVGILFGTSVLDILPDSLMNIAPDIRSFALIIILLRAGLSLDLKELKGVGRSAILMCFVPAIFEMIVYLLFAVAFFNLSAVDALLLGSVMTAVSPAVIVPRMIKIKNESYGTKKGIPQLLLASSSVDDIFVIILFTSFLSMSSAGGISLSFIYQIPITIILGIGVGLLVGFIFCKVSSNFNISTLLQVIVLVCLGITFVFIEDIIGEVVPYSGLLSVMSMSAMYYKMNSGVANKLQLNLSKIWLVAEVLLFTLVGAVLDISYLTSNIWLLLAMIVLALVVRMIGVFVCFIKSQLNKKERLFCMVSYTPKATVQAGIGAIPLSLGLLCGNLILSCAILGILFTAPIGAFMIDGLYKKLLPLDKIEMETVADTETIANTEKVV